MRGALILALVFAIGVGLRALLPCAKTKDELLFFHAAWCVPCKAMEPAIHDLAKQHIAVREVDVDGEPALAQQFRVRQVPTLVRLHNGKEAGRLIGQVSAAELRKFAKSKEKK